jgi:hypothetical protein
VLSAALLACNREKAPGPEQPLPPQIQALVDERDVLTVADALDDAADRKQWDEAQTYFDTDVDVDFSSFGGAPGRISAAGLIKNWQQQLTADKQSFHMRGGNVVTISGDAATIVSHGYAYTRITTRPINDLYEVWGVYEHHLTRTPQGWKINGLKFTKTYSRGDPAIRAITVSVAPDTDAQADSVSPHP